MSQDNMLHNAFERIRADLQSFVALSMQENENSWDKWISAVESNLDIKCWEKKQCSDTECPAYQSNCRRCWIIAGTCCDDGNVQCQFAKHYSSCQNCDVFQEAVCKNPLTEIQEYLIILTHSLRTKQVDLTRIATTDSLTGLFNRNYFEITIPREIEKAKRRNGNLLFVMIDIDNFKHFNDSYGHQYGDDILKQSAAILQKSIRAEDLLVRYGGDEFLVVMYPDNKDNTGNFEERIEKHLSEWNRVHAKPGSKLAFSIGCAMCSMESLVTDVIREADKEMYRNKFSKR